MSALGNFQEFRHDLIAELGRIDALIERCPIDPDESPWVNDSPRDNLKAAKSDLEAAVNFFGHAIQEMQAKETP